MRVLFFSSSTRIVFASVFFFLTLTPINAQLKGVHNDEYLSRKVLFDFESLTSNDNFYEDYKKIGVYSFSKSRSSELFFTINGVITDQRNQGLSTGIGFRKESKESIIGVNFFHDFFYYNKSIHQLGFGIEYFSDIFLSYGNVYLPIGGRKANHKDLLFDDYIGDYLVDCEQSDILGKSFEVVISPLSYWIYALHSSISLGAYGIMFTKNHKAFGVLGRIRISDGKQIYFEPQINYDKLYGVNFGLFIGFVFPNLGKNHSIYKPVSRKMGVNYERFCNYRTNY